MLVIMAALSGALAILMGALTSHHEHIKSTPGLVSIASDYHFYHSICLLFLGLCLEVGVLHKRILQISGICFVFGILFFCGSIYLRALTEIKVFSYVMPSGGILLLLGWLTLGMGCLVSLPDKNYDARLSH